VQGSRHYVRRRIGARVRSGGRRARQRWAGSTIVRRNLSSRRETTGCAASSASTSETNRSCGELCVDEREDRVGRDRHGVDQAVRDGVFRYEDLQQR
jgi:hypothetical protein